MQKMPQIRCARRQAHLIHDIGLSASSPQRLHKGLYLAGREGIGIGPTLGEYPQGHGACHEHVVVASAAGGISTAGQGLVLQ